MDPMRIPSMRSTHPSGHGGTESLHGKTLIFMAFTHVDLSLGFSGTVHGCEEEETASYG